MWPSRQAARRSALAGHGQPRDGERAGRQQGLGAGGQRRTVVVTSSTRTTQRPRGRRPPRRSRPGTSPNAPATLACRWARSSSYWATVAPPSLEDRGHRKAERARRRRRPAGRPGRSRAPGRGRRGPAPARAGRRPRPTRRQRSRGGRAERRRQAALAGVLEGMERGAHGAVERRGPLELDERRRERRREAERDAGRPLEANVERRATARADRLALATAAGAGRRQGQIEDAAGEAARCRHRPILPPADHRRRIRDSPSRVSAPRRRPRAGPDRRPPCRSDRACRSGARACRGRRGRTRRSPARAAGHAGRPRPHGRRRAPARPRKTQSIGKRMNIMWIPLPPGSQSPAPSGSPARPIRPMNRAHSESADSSRSARLPPRVRLTALERHRRAVDGRTRAGGRSGSPCFRRAATAS